MTTGKPTTTATATQMSVSACGGAHLHLIDCGATNRTTPTVAWIFHAAENHAARDRLEAAAIVHRLGGG